MKRTMLAIAAALGLAVMAPAVWAHAGHGLTIGEVVSVSADGFELKTARATVTVKITAETKFEKDTKPAERALLKKGERVGVEMKKAASGELSAGRIVFGLPAPESFKD